MRSRFSIREQAIVAALYTYSKPMTINEIAKATGASWNTIKAHIKRLVEEEWIIKVEKNEKEYWKLNY